MAENYVGMGIISSNAGAGTIGFLGLMNTFVPLELVSKIVDWNRKRNNLEFDDELEEKLLGEELSEYWEADTIVGKLDSICDTFFVGVGTLAKSAKNLEAVEGEFLNYLQFNLTDFMSRMLAEGYSSNKTIKAIHKGLEIVLEANEQKLATKNKDGKVTKPKGFIPPEQKLEKMLKELKEEAEIPPHMQPRGM